MNANQIQKSFIYLKQGAQIRTLFRKNESNFASDGLALPSIFGLCFMPVCIINSNCYSLIYSSLTWKMSKWKQVHNSSYVSVLSRPLLNVNSLWMHLESCMRLFLINWKLSHQRSTPHFPRKKFDIGVFQFQFFGEFLWRKSIGIKSEIESHTRILQNLAKKATILGSIVEEWETLLG